MNKICKDDINSCRDLQLRNLMLIHCIFYLKKRRKTMFSKYSYGKRSKSDGSNNFVLHYKEIKWRKDDVRRLLKNKCRLFSPYLPDHGVPDHHGEGGVPAVHGHGEVEGGDDT